MIISAGYLTYLNLSSIVNTLKDESSPDLRLLNLKELSSDLSEADNSVRLYLVTNEDDYLQPFYKLMETADERMKRLYYYNEDMPFQLMIIDSIEILVEQKLEVWDEMLNLRNDNRVSDAINELSEKFLTEEPDSLTNTEEEGFLQRFFTRKKEQAPPSIQKEELKEELSRLEKLRKIDSLANVRIKVRESELLEKNKELSTALNLLISKIEEEENASLIREAGYADELAANTFNWLIIFGVSLFLLLVIVFLVIVNYVRKTRASQQALEEAKLQAENLARTKELFMANVSHEMRTPMNAIFGLSEQLLIRDDVSSEVRSQLEVIGKSSNHLLAVINDILDFSKIQSGKIQLESIHFKPASVFEEVYQLNSYQAKTKNIDFRLIMEPGIPEVLIGDPVRLKQILLNVISNAIKFTDFGDVSIYVSAKKQKDSVYRLRIRIEDSGIGIDKDRLAFIFDDFTQEEKSTTRRYGGTGLGLAIVKKLTELMQGVVRVESEKKKGTTFRIVIPFKEGDIKELPVEDVPDKSAPDFQGINALVVDDEEYNRLVLRLILKKWNIKFSEAENGEEALEKIKNDHFDVVLMDIRMPVLDGITATKKIRQDPDISPDLKVIALSATNAKEDVEECFSAGMNSFLLKPFNEKSLRKTFDYLMQSIPREKIEMSGGKESKKPGIVSEKLIPEPGIRIEPPQDVLDLKEVYRLGGGDKKFIYELLQVFVVNSDKALNEMEESLKKQDYFNIAESAHRISSACLHLKALNLHSCLKSIERKARSGTELEEIPDLLKNARIFRDSFVLLVQSHMEELKKSF